jgi:transposase-like protein
MSTATLRQRPYNVKNLEVEQKIWLVNEIIEGRTTAASAAKTYSLKRTSITSWVSRYRQVFIF